MIWMVWALNSLLWVGGTLVILGLIFKFLELTKAFWDGFRGKPEREYQLTPKQEELNYRAMFTRKRNANRELLTEWTDRFSDLQIQAQKRRLEAQQDKEKEKE